ncbi:MAG: hypothetical protein WC332_00425 [Clostridia bacterium]|jgi:hypothetical protein
MDIKSLEREVELLRELVELKTKLLELEKGFSLPYVPYPVYPQRYEPYPYNPVTYPWVTYQTGTATWGGVVSNTTCDTTYETDVPYTLT